MSTIKDVVSALAVPAACLGGACGLALLWLGALTAWERIAARWQTAAWARSTRSHGWELDTAAIRAFEAHINEAELGDAIDDAVSPQRIAQLEALYVRQEETR